MRVDDSVFIVLTLISPVSHRPALAAVRMSQRTPAVQLLCLFTLLLFRPSSVNKHLVAVSYSQLLCASGFCRSERCQFTDQRPAMHCGNSRPIRCPYSYDWTQREMSVRPAPCRLRCTVCVPFYKQLFSFLNFRGLPFIFLFAL